MDTVVELEHLDGGIALVTLTNGKVNALSGAVVARIGEIAAELTATPPKVVVVTGGPKIFAAGADISEFGGAEEAVGITERIHVALDALAAIPRFVIAEVSGYALGGGCELALACDYRIASERAVFGQPEVLLGTIPGGGGTQRLARHFPQFHNAEFPNHVGRCLTRHSDIPLNGALAVIFSVGGVVDEVGHRLFPCPFLVVQPSIDDQTGCAPELHRQAPEI